MNRFVSSKLIAGSALALALVAGLAAMNFGTQSSAIAEPTKTAAPADAAAGDFKVDAVHSCVIFKIKHMNAGNFYGRFNDVAGTFALGADSLKIDVTVKADSVDSNNSKRDEHLKSNDFFSVKEFPTVTFKADKLTKSGDGMFGGSGKLTFRGVTKDVNVRIEPTGSGKGREGKAVAGIEARLSIKRSDFGNNFMVGKGLGDDVELIVALEGNAQ